MFASSGALVLCVSFVLLAGCGGDGPSGSGGRSATSRRLVDEPPQVQADTLDRPHHTPVQERFAPAKEYTTEGYGDTIGWDPERPLTWADYHRQDKDPHIVDWAAANTTLRLHCVPVKSGNGIAWDVRALFKPSLSWVDPRGMADSSLLHHERLHFDIAELYARKLRRYLSTYNGPYTKQGADAIKVTIGQFRDSLDREGERYDLETRHNGIAAEQLRWRKEVADRLRELEGFRGR